MNLPLTLQLYQAAVSLGTGAVIGLVYDLLRAYRRNKKRGVSHGADALFWGLACVLLFFLGMRFGDGQLRIFMAVCALLGSIAYLLIFSPVILPLLCRGLEILVKRASARPAPSASFWKTTVSPSPAKPPRANWTP